MLTWFGAVRRNPQVESEPLIEAVFTPLRPEAWSARELDPGTDLDPSQSRRIDLGVGLLPGLYPGQIWEAGLHVRTAQLQRETFRKLEITTRTARIVSDGSRVDVPLSGGSVRIPIIPYKQYPLVRPHRSANNGHGARCLSVRTENPDTRVLIPCVEIIRFYYASSTVLSREVFTGFLPLPSPAPKRGDPLRHLTELYNNKPEVTWRLPDHRSGEAHVRLRKRMLDRDAPMIARLRFSEICRGRAIRVQESIIENGLKSGVPVPTAWPAFEGQTDLRVRGLWLRTTVEEREIAYFLVFRIESCSSPFPFGSLIFTRDNAGGANRDGVRDPKAPPQFRQSKPRGSISDPVRQNEEPSNETALQETSLSDARFTALEEMYIKKGDREPAVRGRRTVSKPPRGKAEGLGTGEGRSGETPLDRLAFTSGSEVEEEGSEAPTEEPVRTHSGMAEFLAALEEVNLQNGMEIETRKITHHNPRHRSNDTHPGSLLRPPKGGRPRWLYLDPSRLIRRRLLIGEVQFRGVYIYACEVECREKEAYTMLILAAPDGHRLSDAELVSILDMCAEVKGRWKHWEAREFQRYTPEHRGRDLDWEPYVAQLERTLVANIKKLARDISPEE